MRWRLLLEEYGPELKHLEGHKNKVADALSWLNIKTTETELKDLQSLLLFNAECYADDKLPDEIFPLSFKVIQKHQQLDKELLIEAKTKPTNNYSLQQFRGGGKIRHLICYDGKIVFLNHFRQELSSGIILTYVILVKPELKILLDNT